MRRLITLLFVATLTITTNAEDFINGAYYIKASPADLTFRWVGQSNTEIVPLKMGRTYSSEKNLFELITKDDQSVTLQLSSGLLVQVSPNSEFRIDAFNQMIADATIEPEILRAGDFILNISLMNGSAHIIAPKYSSSNTMCVLQTPLMNLELNDGKYHIKASQKFTFVYILEGHVGIFNNQSNKKTTEHAGTAIIIFPSPMKATETMVTKKSIEPDEFQKMSLNLQKVENLSPKMSFVVIGGKIIGIKLQ